MHVFGNLHNSSWFNSSTVCKEFLLEGAGDSDGGSIASVVRRPLGMFEWEGSGEWFYPLEVSNPNWSLQHEYMGGGDGGHDTSFSVYQMTDVIIGVEWGNFTDLVQTFGGRLVLKNFWNIRSYSLTEEAAADIDYQQLQDLKLLLHGGFVHMDVDRRVCMVGCAFRIDFPYERDCEFVLKMKYPNRPTLATPNVEGELSSARRADDPLRFPAFRIIGPRTIAESEYEYRSEEFLRSALNMSSNIDYGNSPPSTSDPEDLVTYLEHSGAIYRAVIVPTSVEQAQIQKQGKVVVGPFSTPYYPSQEVAFPTDLAAIEVTLQFKNIVTRASNLSGKIVVRGSMKMVISHSPYTPFVEQRPFSVEGIWDPMSEELCMIGCREDSLSTNPQLNTSWKFCIKSVLRRYVSIDSPLEGAVLSSLYADVHHSDHFTPIGFLRQAAIYYMQEQPDMKKSASIASLTTYRYTVTAKAEELAKTTTPEEALDKRWFHPRYPTPYDVKDLCKATENMRSSLSSLHTSLLYDADGRVVDMMLGGFEVTYLESCVASSSFEYLPWDTPLKTFVAGSYLKVAFRFGLVRTSRSRESALTSTPWQCGAEGVYEPFTGKMHLVVHLMDKYMDGIGEGQLVAPFWPLKQNVGGGDVGVKDHEIYMKLQFPSSDFTMTSAEEEALDPSPEYSPDGAYIHRYKVNMRVESLRPQSDPLYFKPLVARNYPL
ncbi:hypothetical protein M758_5G144900 [Ceratodon purpureus]|nr:hypothetical protein M758_5G144900 [Ceratodon purpureus]